MKKGDSLVAVFFEELVIVDQDSDIVEDFIELPRRGVHQKFRSDSSLQTKQKTNGGGKPQDFALQMLPDQNQIRKPTSGHAFLPFPSR